MNYNRNKGSADSINNKVKTYAEEAENRMRKQVHVRVHFVGLNVKLPAGHSPLQDWVVSPRSLP